MRQNKIEGSFVALITPMNDDYSVDYGGFRRLLEFQAENNTSAILIMGSTGEVSMLSPEERLEIMSLTSKMKPKDVELWFGCTGTNTQQTIDYCRAAASEGADGAIVAAPAYIAAPENDIVDYFVEVADESPIPVGIYNNPPRVRTDLSHTALLKLAEHPNIVVNKESTSRTGQVAQTIAGHPDMSLMCCDSPNLGLVIPLMSLGGNGTANMSGNVIPREMAVISTPWREWRDAMACRETWLENLPLLHFLYSVVNPVSLKTLMRALGLPAGPLRKPLKALSSPALAVGLEISRRLELDKKYAYRISPD
ncbi:MAG: 4-hydroxy-tetrahydrodipicolinate synthase [Gammaproteobacteria bacterium]|nr:4-hydroxy-tetrahydrodipicolinate synthase [Gammaproteobacteria bacterium]